MDRPQRDYQKLYRILLILFIISFSGNVLMLGLYLQGRKSGAPFTSEESIKVGEIKKIEVAKSIEVPKKIEAPKKLEVPKKDEVTKKDVGGQEVEPTPPAGMIPLSFIYVKENEHILICEKKSKTLALYRSTDTGFSFVKSYPSIVGSNHVDKKEAGDRATPEGVYFLISFMTGASLPEKYGYGAYSLNYPNFLDRREGKKGNGIWLHGYRPHLERPPFSEGCVVVKDEDLKELSNHLRVGDTPLAIVDTVQYQSPEDQKKRLEGLSQFLKEWKTAWEGRNTEKYIGFYAKDFVSSDGKNYQKFKEYKYRVNQGKRFIQVRIEPKSYLLSQKDGGNLAILRVNQNYRSDNFASFSRKILYLRENQRRWEIIGETTF